MRASHALGLLLVELVFVTEFSWEVRTVATVESANPAQLAAKLLSFALLAGVGLLLLLWGGRPLAKPQWAFLGFIAWGGLAALVGTSNRVTLVTSLALLMVAFGVFSVSAWLDRPPLTYGYIALAAIVVASLVAYAVNPVQFSLVASNVSRLRGVVGHSNGLGQVAAMGVILHLGRFRRSFALRDALWWLLLAAFLLALVLSKARASMVMLAVALLVSFAFKLYRRNSSLGLPIVTLLLGAGAVAGVIFAPSMSQSLGDGLASAASRSGDAQELGTLTGRVEIWDAASDLIAQRPVVGYGWRASETVLVQAWFETHGQVAFFPVHPHSMYLNVLLSTGLVGACLLAASLALLARSLTRIPSSFAGERRDAVWYPLLLFWVGVGVTENAALGVTNTSFAMFMLLMADVAWHGRAWTAERRARTLAPAMEAAG